MRAAFFRLNKGLLLPNLTEVLVPTDVLNCIDSMLDKPIPLIYKSKYPS